MIGIGLNKRNKHLNLSGNRSLGTGCKILPLFLRMKIYLDMKKMTLGNWLNKRIVKKFTLE